MLIHIQAKAVEFSRLFFVKKIVFSVIFLWWSVYYIIIQHNVSLEFKLYVVFVVILELFLSKISQKLKKELFNKKMNVHE